NFSQSISSVAAAVAVKAVKENDPATLSYSDREYVLSYRDASPANKSAADKVWAAMQAETKNGAVKIELPVTVISSTANAIEAAISDDAIKAKRADVHIAMA